MEKCNIRLQIVASTLYLNYSSCFILATAISTYKQEWVFKFMVSAGLSIGPTKG